MSQKATNTKLFHKLNHSLISLGHLCDNNCIVILTKKDLTVVKNNETIMKGTRSTSGDGLWDIPIPPKIYTYKNAKNNTFSSNITYPKPTQNSLDIILRTDKRASDLAAYFYVASFSPVKHTFLNAIKHFFLNMARSHIFLNPKTSCGANTHQPRPH